MPYCKYATLSPDTLKTLHLSGKRGDVEVFKPIPKLNLMQPNEDVESHPTYGFKRQLIRAIGNIAYDCRDAQNWVSGKRAKNFCGFRKKLG